MNAGADRRDARGHTQSGDDALLTAVDQAAIREGIMNGVNPLLDRQFSEFV